MLTFSMYEKDSYSSQQRTHICTSQLWDDHFVEWGLPGRPPNAISLDEQKSRIRQFVTAE